MKNLRILSVVCAFLISSVPITTYAVGVSGQGTWETTLQGRDLDGDLSTAEAYYDTVLNITWLEDANYANAQMDWTTANSWAAGLDPYGSGITGWRLPIAMPIDGSNFDTTLSTDGTTDKGTAAPTTDGSDGGWRDGLGNPASEMGHMYYVNLGNLGSCDPDLPFCTTPPGWGLINTGPFSNIQSSVPDFYWSDTGYMSNIVWVFSFRSGFQATSTDFAGYFAWAVHSGDVGTPIPVAVTIDIMPSMKAENAINLKKKNLKVAIVGSIEFDALQVDPTTVKFGTFDPDAASPTRYKGKDYNRDGYSDLILTFNRSETGIACDVTEATLTGETYAGVVIEGSDTFTVKPCP